MSKIFYFYVGAFLLKFELFSKVKNILMGNFITAIAVLDV